MTRKVWHWVSYRAFFSRILMLYKRQEKQEPSPFSPHAFNFFILSCSWQNIYLFILLSFYLTSVTPSAKSLSPLKYMGNTKLQVKAQGVTLMLTIVNLKTLLISTLNHISYHDALYSGNHSHVLAETVTGAMSQHLGLEWRNLSSG